MPATALTFQLFAQSLPPRPISPPSTATSTGDGPLAFVKHAAGLSEGVMGKKTLTRGDSTISR